MSFWKEYGYVDAHYEHPRTKARMPWVRLLASDVDERIVKEARHQNCFTSVQRFRDAVSIREMLRKQEELATKAASELTAEEREQLDSEALELPEQQPHYHGIFFDFDCDPEKMTGGDQIKAIGQSLEDARKVVNYFIEFHDLPDHAVQCWFSGSKGFHVYVRPEPMDIRPHRHLTYIVKNIAFELRDGLDLPTLDTSVYSVPRMWRIPNTVHQKTGRYKIELTTQELLTLDAEQIIERSRSPRSDIKDLPTYPIDGNRDQVMLSHVHEPTMYTEEISPEPDHREWFNGFIEMYESYRDLRNVRPRRAISKPEDGAEFPVCVKDIMEGGPKPGGPNRNRIIMPLAGFFHDAGLPKEETIKQIDEFTRTWYPERAQLRGRIKNGRSVVDQAYRGGTRFACRFMRSLRGTGPSGTVKCVGEQECPWVQDPDDQMPEKVPTVHLSEATRGCYVETKVKTPVHVAALAGSPFDLPIKGEVVCKPDPNASICQGCNNLAHNGAQEFTFSADDSIALRLVKINQSERKAVIKAKCGIPQKCYKNHIKIAEHSNIEELQVIPMVDYSHTIDTDAENDTEVVQKASRHVVRTAFNLGHGIQANKKYMMEALVTANPKDQRVVFLSDKFEAAHNDIDEYRLTPELREALKIFQRKPGESVLHKMKSIHRDFTANVHRIGGRNELSMAVDLCYHSVIGFRFAGDYQHKGWFELLVLGDTSSGKSTLTERMMRHFGLGELIAGEDSKRTGLVYASIQMQGQWILRWGKVPQNDRRLLVIDEFAGIPAEEIGKMTQLRSSGIASGGGVNADFETFARTRLIFLTNPRDHSGEVAGFNYGINAIRGIFKESQDVRRVDLAVVAARQDVDTSVVNKRWDDVNVPHIYTSDLCRNLVLWAWSREPHHVEWEEGAEDMVLGYAREMGDTYECDIPLAERADLKHKIARIAVATAARLFSTDEEGKKVIVTMDHVAFAAKFMDRSYRREMMGYFHYARRYKQDNHLTPKRKREIRETINGFDEPNTIVSELLEADTISKPVFTDMVNLEREELNRLWKYLVRERLLRKTARGWRKTSAFTQLLRGMSDEHKRAELPLDDLEEEGAPKEVVFDDDNEFETTADDDPPF